MSSVIEWKSATEMIEILKQQNAMVAGMSVAEAAAALGFTKTASGIYVKTIVTTTATAVTTTTATAAAGGVASATTSAGNLVLFESATGGASVGGLSSVAAPVALSIAAGVGGYLVGNKIAEENDEFLSKMLFPVFDFFTGQNIADSLYDDGMIPYDPAYVPLSKVPTIPMIYDQNCNTFMDSRFTGKVKELFDSVSATLPVKEITSSLFIGKVFLYKLNAGDRIHAYTLHLTNDRVIEFTLEVLSGTAYCVLGTNAEREWCRFTLLSLNPFTATIWENSSNNKLSINSGTVNGTKFYKAVATSSLKFKELLNVTNLVQGLSFPIKGNIDMTNLELYSILTSTGDITGGLPSGVIKYTPGQSDVEPLKFPDEIPQWTPVAIPEPAAVPGTMPAPVEYPDPSPRPEKITPYINPIQPQPENVPIKKPDPDFKPIYPIIPVPNPVPDSSTDPVPPPDATKDPSQELKPILPPQEVPTDIPKPKDIGETPTPILPVVPPITSSATGLLHVYNPTNAQINEFGSWLWTTFSGDLMETLSKLFNNPMDAVIGLHEIYCTPSTGENSTIKAGFLDSEVPSRLVSSRYVNISCGAVGVPEYWNNYLDYAPYTKAYCYLPFIGIVELNADDIVGSGVEISYKIDTYNGSCIAMITTAKPDSPESVTYQFSGNCAVEVPITSGMKSATQGALLGASVAGFAAATVTGGGGAVLGATAVGSLRGASNSKNSVQYSGSFGSSYGAMGIKTPYLIIKRPKQKVVYGYNENYGYPAHKMVHIAKCSGYLKAIEVDVVSPTATEDEKKLIEEQLKSGIFVD